MCINWTELISATLNDWATEPFFHNAPITEIEICLFVKSSADDEMCINLMGHAAEFITNQRLPLSIASMPFMVE